MNKHDVMNNIYDLIMNNKKQDESFIKGFQEGYIENQNSIVLIDEPLGVRFEVKAWIKPNVSEYGGYSIETTAILDDVQGFCFDCNKQTDIEYDDDYEEKV